MGRVRRVTDEDVSPAMWALAREREPIIRDLVATVREHGETEDAVRAASQALGLSRATIFRLVKRYSDDPRTASLLPKRPGFEPGTKLLDPKVDAIITTHIEGRYLSRQKPTKKAVVADIAADCRERGLPPPDRKTVLARIAGYDTLQQVKRREGRAKAAALVHPAGGSLVASEPLEIVQIDHTPVDLLVVEEDTRRVIGRPWVSVALDIHTRMICGFHVGFLHPSLTSVALCLTHAVMDKAAWLQARGIDASWPVRGLPKLVHTDNAKEFRSKHLLRHLENYGVKVDFRKKGQPQHGGHVESVIRRLMKEVHNYPGTTFSNVKERGAYDSEGTACLTLRDLEYLLASFIVEYHHTVHSGIGMPPQAKWEEWERTAGERRRRMPPDIREFYCDLLPSQPKRVRDYAVRMFNIKYWHSALTTFQDRRLTVEVHYDPRDVSRVFVRGPSGAYLEVPYKDTTHPPLSLWEYKAVQDELRAQGRDAQDERLIFEQLKARRRRIDAAQSASKRARREAAMRPSAERRPGAEANDALPRPIIEAEYSVVDERSDDTPLELPFFETEVWDD